MRCAAVRLHNKILGQPCVTFHRICNITAMRAFACPSVCLSVMSVSLAFTQYQCGDKEPIVIREGEKALFIVQQTCPVVV